MKKLILTGFMAVGVAAGVLAQGQLTFDNGNNSSNSPTATSGGLVYLNGAAGSALVNPQPVSVDVNAALLGGATAGSLSQLAILQIAGNGLAQGDVTGIGTPGIVTDLSGALITVAGTGANGNGFFQVEFWTGNDLTYAEALADGSFAGISSVFVNPTGGTAPVTPTDLTGMPAVVMVSIAPEPTTLALCGLGAASLLLFRRKK